MDFSKLKKNKTNMDKLVSAAQEAGSDKKKGAGQDDRIWKPTVDKMGNGYAIIRFLPSGDNDDLPWARYWDHGFKGPTGQWLFEKSLTTLGQPCPISEMNQVLWNSGDDNDKKIVRERKRRLHYVANILVLEDPSAPDNEGKVFLYDFGKKIFDKIMDAMQPQYPDEKPMNPFDLWEGGDFVMKIRKVEGYRNYDKSEFKKASELLDGDDTKLEATCSQIMELSEFTDPSIKLMSSCRHVLHWFWVRWRPGLSPPRYLWNRVLPLRNQLWLLKRVWIFPQQIQRQLGMRPIRMIH